MKLIVGLGNPGARYERTRHNAGFMVVDRLRDRHAPTEPAKSRFHAAAFEARIRGERCLLLKPLTYMNRSGQAVGEALRFYKTPVEDVLVITDDFALPLGDIRVRPSGGTGGHNGLADITRVLGTDAFPRLRVGIGGKPAVMNQADYVLSRFGEDEADDLARGIDTGADATECVVEDGVQRAMNTFNRRRADADRPGKDTGSTSEEVHPGWLDSRKTPPREGDTPKR